MNKHNEQVQIQKEFHFENKKSNMCDDDVDVAVVSGSCYEEEAK